MAIFGRMWKWMLIVVLSCQFLTFTSRAQQGLPFITEIELGRQFNDSRISSMVQDGEETMFFSTSRGLLKFDGSTWERIATASPVIRIYYHASSDRIFAGLRSGAIEIVRSDSGNYSVKPIAGISSRQPIAHIIGTEKELFFIGETEIFSLDPKAAKAKAHPFPDKLISGAFVNEGRFYVLFYQEGLFEWNAGKPKKVGNNPGVAENQMLFAFETLNGTYLGFDNDVLVRFRGNQFHPIADQLSSFLADNILSDGLLLNDSLMAISSLAGGAVVVNIHNHHIRYRFDYASGARDNEIFCLGRDQDAGLWLAYEAGISRVDLAQPIKSFAGYPGLEGSLTASLVVNNKLYVGTGNGVFLLRQATNKAEMDRVVKEMMRKNVEARSSNSSPIELAALREEKREAELIERFKENPDDVKEELSKKELRDLKKEIRKQRRGDKKNRTAAEAIEDFFTGGNSSEEDEEAEPEVVELKPSAPSVSSNPSPKKAATPTNTAIISPNVSNPDSYLYQKVKGIDVKCRQLIHIDNEVFAATNNGLYSITAETATNLTPGLYIHQVTTTNDRNKLLLATLNGVYELSRQTGGKWLSRPLKDSLKFAAYNVIEDGKGNVWAGTDNGAYLYAQGAVKYHSVPEKRNEKVLVCNIKGTVHFLLPSGIFYFDAASKTIIPTELAEVPASDRLEFVLGNRGMIWVRTERGWQVLNGEAYVPMLQYLELFEDIRNLSTDENGNVYIIDKGRNLYSVSKNSGKAEKKFNIYIRQVLDASGKPFSLVSSKLNTDGGALIFNVSAPFYLKSKGTQYQYRIEGHRDNWSRWSDDPEIDPGNFSPGDYVLEVRARNILGEVSEIKTLAFTVPQPLFLRWYFLVLYVLLLSLIVLIIIKVRERSLKETQRILEDKVAQRTAELAKAKDQTEKLLLNILPKETAQELKVSGQATARHYNQVSVLFTDFKGFTEFAENTQPQELVNELHRCFVGFDEIIGKYFLEKIKTIGDAYMCAGGVPIRNNSNAIAITLAALEIRDFMAKVEQEKREKNEPVLEIRIGIHTGPLTAGVVGLKKFAYDIWGDTVNTASRMETASDPGKVNVSGATYQLIKKYFDCTYRGQKEVKGKGLVEMYFVNEIKSEFSVNGDGKTPNEQLWELIS